MVLKVLLSLNILSFNSVTHSIVIIYILRAGIRSFLLISCVLITLGLWVAHHCLRMNLSLIHGDHCLMKGIRYLRRCWSTTNHVFLLLILISLALLYLILFITLLFHHHHHHAVVLWRELDLWIPLWFFWRPHYHLLILIMINCLRKVVEWLWGLIVGCSDLWDFVELLSLWASLHHPLWYLSVLSRI